jgi:hypothetical protein
VTVTGLSFNFGIIVVVTKDMVGVVRVAGHIPNIVGLVVRVARHIPNIVRVGPVFLSSAGGTANPTWRSWRSR